MGKDIAKKEEGWLIGLLAGSLWKRQKCFYDGSNNKTYECLNMNIDAAETDTDWYVWKRTYTGSLVAEMEGPRKGAVDSEPSGLAWNI